MKLAIADAELQLVQEALVLHDVERVEHVEAECLGSDEQLLHAIPQTP